MKEQMPHWLKTITARVLTNITRLTMSLFFSISIEVRVVRHALRSVWLVKFFLYWTVGIKVKRERDVL